MAAALGAGFVNALFRALGQGPGDLTVVDESLTGQLIFYSNSKSNPEHIGVFVYDLKTRKWRVILDDVHPEGFCRASPDRKSFALTEWMSDQPRVSIIGPNGRTKVSELRSRISWAPGGREVVLSEWRIKGRLRSKTWRMNMDGTGRVQLPIPDNELVLDWSPDGLWLLVCNRVYNETNKDTIIRRRADGTDPRPLIDAKTASKVGAGRFSPDGRRVAYTRIRVDQELNMSSLWVIDVATRQDRMIMEGDADGYPENSPCWSPDGKNLAVSMSDRDIDTTDRNVRIEIVDLRGNRVRQLGIPHKHPIPCDWR